MQGVDDDVAVWQKYKEDGKFIYEQTLSVQPLIKASPLDAPQSASRGQESLYGLADVHTGSVLKLSVYMYRLANADRIFGIKLHNNKVPAVFALIFCVGKIA